MKRSGVWIASEISETPGKPPHKDHSCWSKGWVKTDLLPRWVEIRFHISNVDLQVKLADFGCASSVDNVRAPAGSRKYWSPELLLYWLGGNSKT